MWKTLIGYAMGGTTTSPKEMLVKIQWLFVITVILGVIAAVSLIIGEYYLARSGFKYLSETRAYSDSFASLLIGCAFIVQAVVLFCIMMYKVTAADLLGQEEKSQIVKIKDAFIEGFKSAD